MGKTIYGYAVYRVALIVLEFSPSSKSPYIGRSSNVGQTRHSLGLVQVEI